MIDVLFEQRVIQNTGLGAEALWQAVNEAYESSGRSNGVSFPLVFVVLPLVLHRRSAQALATKTQPGGLYKAISDDREITIGLQQRMQSMADKTLQSLSIGLDTGLLRIDDDKHRQLYPLRRTLPVTHTSEEVKTILGASKRIGQAFSEMTLAEIATHLNIEF